MSEPSINIQAWICPFCIDDHSSGRDCKQEDLKKRIIKLLISKISGVTEREVENFNMMIEML
jgi:hypothetical protein